MKREIELLVSSIQERFIWAHKAEGDCATLVESRVSVQRGEPDEDWDDATLRLSSYTEKLEIEVGMLAELLHLPLALGKFQERFRKHENRLGSVNMEPGSDYPVSAALGEVSSFFHSLLPAAGMTQGSRLDTFRSILAHTAKIVSDFNIEPRNEADVRNAVLKVVKYAFPDATREVNFNPVIKNYQGDIGVFSLSAVAEYKYIDTEDEMKTCLDGIYSDMKSYRHGSDWRHFYAVFYMTKPFYTQEVIDSAFASVRAEQHWHAIVINGDGTRTKRESKRKAIEPKSERDDAA